MKCASCGASNPEGASWCGQCFSPLASAPSPGAGSPQGAVSQQGGAPLQGSPSLPGTTTSFQSQTLREAGLAYDPSGKQRMFDADGKMIGAPGGAPREKKSGTPVIALIVVFTLIVLGVAAFGYFFFTS